MDVLHRFTDDTDGFHDTLVRGEPAVFHPADPPTELFPLDELDRWLARLSEFEHGCVDADAAREPRHEATLLLRHLDQRHPGLHAFCAAMREQLGRQVEALYVGSPAGIQGRPVRRDDADVFVVQISGAEDWHLYGGLDGDRWAPGPAEVDGGPEFTTRLEIGDVLYVPRGHAHRAVASGRGACAHLSFTVREAGRTQLHDTLADLLSPQSGPLRPIGEIELLAVADQMLADARSTLAKLTAEALVVRARARMSPAKAPVTCSF